MPDSRLTLVLRAIRGAARPAVWIVGMLLVSPGNLWACGSLSAPDDSPRFPLKVRQGQRYLEDAAGKPFFVQGDSAWSLIAQLTREQAELYLDDRKARGFNTILVNLVEHRFASNAPANIYGDDPFNVPGDFATPNETYFRHADWVLRRACELGFVVLLVPSYAGYDGGPDGWYQEMTKSGAEKLYEYGRFVGRRYSQFENIIWVQAGDYNPPEKELVRALAKGIEQEDPGALQTAHGPSESAALDEWAGEPWLSVNNLFTYGPVHTAALAQYVRDEPMPFIVIESAYENEYEAGEDRIRVQAYQSILSGASGHIFGNNPIWHFDGPGLFSAPMTWQQALDSPGTRSMTIFANLISSVKWWLLQPDSENQFLIRGRGGVEERAVAARASDNSFALVYLPTDRKVMLDLAWLKGARIAGRWIDPSDGRLLTAEGSPFTAGSRTFEPPGKNHSGFSDWVLELRSESAADHNQ